MSASTPGPWEHYTETKPSILLEICFETVRKQGGHNIVRLHNKEDARLIAAAPDLLEALEKIVKRYDEDRYRIISIFDVEVARAAISKAKGEQPTAT